MANVLIQPRGVRGRSAAASGWPGVARLAVGFCCLAVLLLLHARNPLDSDEGVVLNGAWNLLNGRVLYSDFFEFIPPGSFYLVLGAWNLFGTGYWTAKLVGVIALALAALGVYRISSLVMDGHSSGFARGASYASTLLYCVFSGYLPAINHNSFHVPLAVWGTYFAVLALRTHSWRMAAAAGLLCGAGAWFLQHRAAALAVGMLIVFCGVAVRSRDPRDWRGAAACLLGFVLPVAALGIGWRPSVLWEHLIVFPATRYLEVNKVDPTTLLLAATFALSAAWLLRKRIDAAVTLLLLQQAALLLMALQRPDLGHVTSALFPLLCLMPLVLTTAVEGVAMRTLQVWAAAGLASLSVPLVTFAWGNPALFLADWSHHPALQFVREHCGRSPYLYVGPFAPGLYFETRKLNPSRYAILLPQLHTAAQFAEARIDLERHRPQCAVTLYEGAEKFRYSRTNPVDEYLAANYEVVFEARHRQVWMARTEAPPAKPPVAASPARAAAGQ